MSNTQNNISLCEGDIVTQGLGNAEEIALIMRMLKKRGIPARLIQGNEILVPAAHAERFMEFGLKLVNQDLDEYQDKAFANELLICEFITVVYSAKLDIFVSEYNPHDTYDAQTGASLRGRMYWRNIGAKWREPLGAGFKTIGPKELIPEGICNGYADSEWQYNPE